MTFTDRYGLSLTTSSAKAAELYSGGLDYALMLEAPAEECFREAREEDPGFALAHIAEGRMLQLRGKGAEAREPVARAQSAASGATRRERQHVECLVTAITGDSDAALGQ